MYPSSTRRVIAAGIAAGFALLGPAACGDKSSDMTDLRDAEFAAMSDEQLIREWALLDRKIEELKANPKALPERIEMLEGSREDFARRLRGRDIDPDGIDIAAVLAQIDEEMYLGP